VWVALAIAAGFLLRAWFIVHAPRVDGDALLYGDLARNWLTHGVYGFTQASGPVPTLIRLPGYPLFLALCFRVFGMEHYTAVMLVQAVVDMATCCMAAGLAARLFGRRAAMATLWLAVLCPFTANYVAVVLAETLSLFTIALAFYALERWRSSGLGWNRWLWGIGAALAYALLLRPEQGVLAAAVISTMLWMTWRRDTLNARGGKVFAPVAVAAICVLLPLAPWTIRNWRVFHVVQPIAPRSASDPGESVPVGFQRWYRTWAVEFSSNEMVYWNYNEEPIETSSLPARAFDNEDQYRRTAAILDDYNVDFRATAALDARFEALAEERIRAHPVRYYVALPAARLLNMLLRPRTELMDVSLDWWKWKESRRDAVFGTAYAALNLVYIVLGGIGLWRWKKQQWRGHRELAWGMVLFVMLRCVLLLTLDNSEPRYTLEFFPLLAIWAGAVFREAQIRRQP